MAGEWRLFVVGCSVIAFLLIYGWFIEPQWLETTHIKLNQGGETIRIVLIADLHIRAVGQREEAVLRAVKNADPDLIVFSGDMIDSASREREFYKFLSGLPAVQRMAVLGNWEHWSGLKLHELQENLARHHVDLLVNESRIYKFGTQTIEVIGLDDAATIGSDVAMINRFANRSVAVKRLLVQHSPGFFVHEIASIKADLCLSGHTHGGQIALYGWAPLRPPESGPYVSGLYRTSGCPLYVSRGIGTSVLPIRIGVRPEVAIIDI